MKPHNTVIRGHVIGLGNSEFLAHTTYHGLRIRDADGNVQYFTTAIVAPSVNILLRSAFSSGEEVELWLCGNPDKKMLYGIKTFDDQAYEVAPVKGAISAQATLALVMGLILTIFLIGLLILVFAFVLYGQAGRFTPYERWEFERSPGLGSGGFSSGDHGVAHATVPSRVSAAQEDADRARKVDDLKKWVSQNQAGAK